ncbi:unnamed protein product [Cylicocyclus nassatus]|uniref:Uncharacterized protein n=1 Tax=Cylicocyclus nassatus TaxID=53992 RepID=A0AA36GJ14_CYLNA|nr:unnamed protein product [Cylicocyclus nassatus]
MFKCVVLLFCFSILLEARPQYGLYPDYGPLGVVGPVGVPYGGVGYNPAASGVVGGALLGSMIGALAGGR